MSPATRRLPGSSVRAARALPLVVFLTGLVCGVASAQTPAAAPALSDVLEHAAERVADYFARAQSLMCLETVRIQPLTSGLSADGFGRTVMSELRLAWDPETGGGTEAETRREVIKVNGRPPRENDRRACTTPEQNTTETQPLSMLLPEQRDAYEFALGGPARIDGRRALRVNYRVKAKPTVEVKMVEGLEDCVSFDVDGGRQGRLWIDAETFDVLRLDEWLSGLVDMPMPREFSRRGGARLWTLERHDTSIRFKRVAFSEPSETLVLPVSSTTVFVTRGSGSGGRRATTEYSAYKRFITGARIVPDPQ